MKKRTRGTFWAILALEGLQKLRLTEQDVRVALLGRLVAEGTIQWHGRQHPDWVRADVPVFHDNLGEMKIVLTVSLASPKASFNLMYRGQAIVRLELCNSHTNRCRDDKRFIRERHKHVFTDDCLMNWAYEPVDITTDDPKQAFEQFCHECGMDYKVTWNPPPAKLEGIW